MTKLERLRKAALKSCKWREHKMDQFKTVDPSRPHYKEATCKRCGMVVGINAKPMPNDIEIGGEAVALNCEVTR